MAARGCFDDIGAGPFGGLRAEGRRGWKTGQAWGRSARSGRGADLEFDGVVGLEPAVDGAGDVVDLVFDGEA